MKRISLVLILVYGITFAQVDSKTLEIDYDYFFKQSNSPLAEDYNSTLTINGNESIYEIDVLRKKLPDSYESEGYGNVKVIKPNENRFIYKNLKDNQIYYKESIYFRKFTVKDYITNFNWTLTSNSKEILGYNCQEAHLEYGGRNYIAYFTPDLPISNGPWKFHGLPGLILEIYVVNDSQIEFKLKANKIKISKNKIDITNPFSSNKSYSREEFVKLYKEKYEEVTNYNGEGGVSRSMPKGKIEIIIND